MQAAVDLQADEQPWVNAIAETGIEWPDPMSDEPRDIRVSPTWVHLSPRTPQRVVVAICSAQVPGCCVPRQPHLVLGATPPQFHKAVMLRWLRRSGPHIKFTVEWLSLQTMAALRLRRALKTFTHLTLTFDDGLQLGPGQELPLRWTAALTHLHAASGTVGAVYTVLQNLPPVYGRLRSLELGPGALAPHWEILDNLGIDGPPPSLLDALPHLTALTHLALDAEHVLKSLRCGPPPPVEASAVAALLAVLPAMPALASCRLPAIAPEPLLLPRACDDAAAVAVVTPPLATIAPLAALTSLALRGGTLGCPMLPPPAALLAACPALQCLSVRGAQPCGTALELAAVLAAAADTNRRLHTVALSHTELDASDPEGVPAIGAALAQLPTLHALELETPFAKGSAAAVRRGERAAAALAPVGRRAALDRLVYGDVAAVAPCSQHITPFTRLTSLTFTDACLTPASPFALQQCLYGLPHLRALTFRRCRAGGGCGMVALRRALSGALALRRLSICGDRLDGADVRALAARFRDLKQLTGLALVDCGLDADAVAALAAAAPQLRALTRLDVSENAFADVSGLTGNLPACRQLRRLAVRHMALLGQERCAALRAALPGVTVDLEGSECSWW